MLECLIIGDDFAIDLQKNIPKCELVAEKGINSYDFNVKKDFSFYAETVIINLGSNDTSNINTFDNLFEIRQRVGAKNVFWISSKNDDIVKEVAEYYGDSVVK